MGTDVNSTFALWGPQGSLGIHPDDTVARCLAMLIEGKCMGLGPEKAAQKYGLSRARYFQLQKAYREGGTEALREKKKGPKKNFVRTEQVINQILRYRFLDPDASVAVLTQKMNQHGYNISQRSVERTITEYGLQKKLHTLNSKKRQGPIEVHVTKRRVQKRPADRVSIQRSVRELVARKVSGTLLGTWLLIPEHLRLGTWDLLTTWTGDNTGGIQPRLALQMVHEAALRLNGVRRSRSLCHRRKPL